MSSARQADPVQYCQRSDESAWWSWRCLVVIRWLYENGYGDPQTFPEAAVLRSQT